MSQSYARPLNEKGLIEKFLLNCLTFKENNYGDAVLKILREELLIDNVPQNFSTLHDEKFRHPDFSDEQSRKKLRERIFEELLKEPRLSDDKDITLGKGGARPETLQKDSVAILLTGLPASGKSTIANKIADQYGAYIIDPDYAKLKLPEYPIFGANTVHKESTAITRGNEKTKQEKNLLHACIYHKANVVIPTVGQSLDDIRQERDLLIEKGYKVHFVVVSVSREIATKRALLRFISDHRYVPLGLIFDGYANDPILNYHRAKNDPEWSSYGKISTEFRSPKLIESSNSGSPACLFVDVEGK